MRLNRRARGRPPSPISFEEWVLTRIDEDIAQCPEHSMVAMPDALLDRAAMLTQGMEVDLDAEIEGNVTL